MRHAPLHRSAPFALALAAMIGSPSTARTASAQVALAGAPAANASVRLAGLYRVQLTGRSQAAQRLHLVVRMEETGYTAVLLGDGIEMPIANLQLEGDVIRGNAVTTLGKGDVMLKISDQGVSGTLTVGRVTVDISGDRVG